MKTPALTNDAQRGSLRGLVSHPSIVVESNVPMPEGRFAESGLYQTLRKTLKEMQDGQSFVWDENTMIYRAARESGVKIKTRKLDGDGYRVWRVGMANAPGERLPGQPKT